MEGIWPIILGIVILFLGIPVGKFLARLTKEELEVGQIWFKIIIILGIALGIYGLAVGNDVFLFSGLFVAIVTNRSLKG